MELFDLNACVGKPVQPAAEWYDAPEALLAEMDHYGIARAVVTHYAARQAHPDIGNPATLRFVGSRLAPAWSFVPSVGHKPDAPRFVGAALAAGVRILRFYPGDYFVPFSATAIGDFLEQMEERAFPLLVDFSSNTNYGQFETDWGGLVAVCRAFPRLPVITTEYRIRSNRMLFRALALCQNLRVCTSAIWLYKNIGHIVAEFGAGRLVFGTNIPAFDPAIPVAMLRFAEISDNAKAAIASGNLEALLAGVRR
ncbi:MAG TPA: amidohydrolase family protein [Planctomycetota bacterium]|nr:amidohydrolase family protein [Planctomycetota bacterium]